MHNKPITLKQFMTLHLNQDIQYGKPTKLIIWSPVYHYWFYPDADDWRWDSLSKREQRKLLKTRIRNVSLRDDAAECIAVFLEDTRK